MFYRDAPKTKEEAQAFRYGPWSGNPRGKAYREGQCAMEIARGWHFHQCSRTPGHGPANLYCKQHAKKIAEACNTEQKHGSKTPLFRGGLKKELDSYK